MTSNSDLLASAHLSEAAYAALLDDTGRPLATAQELVDALKRAGWSEAQATVFSTQHRVIHQQPNTATGFSATMFEKLNNGVPTGQYVFAARGTEPTAQFGRDLAVDIGDLVLDGLAWSQIVDMYNYWKRLSTPSGQTYQQAQLVTIPDDGSQAPGTYIRDTDTPRPKGLHRRFRDIRPIGNVRAVA